jgi:hypothetical protein
MRHTLARKPRGWRIAARNGVGRSLPLTENGCHSAVHCDRRPLVRFGDLRMPFDAARQVCPTTSHSKPSRRSHWNRSASHRRRGFLLVWYWPTQAMARRSLWAVIARARLYRLALSARGFAQRGDRQPRIGDGGRRGQATRLHPDHADDAQRPGTRLLPEAGLRHRRDDRLRSAGSDPLLHDEAAGAATRLIRRHGSGQTT